MKTPIATDLAERLFEQHVTSVNMIAHSRATEVAMREVAEALSQDAELWAVTGLLHDLDMDLINGDIMKHGLMTIEILEEAGLDHPEMLHAILAHTEFLYLSDDTPDIPAERESLLDFMLAGVENLTGLICAYSFMRPAGLDGAKAKSLVKKLKDKGFAASVSRKAINDAIEHSGLEQNLLIQIVLDSLAPHAKNFGWCRN